MSSLQIPKPCHKNWDHMTPVEQGRYCQKCVRTVLDVSHWSDENILRTHHESTDGICIRIPKERLQPVKRSTSSFKYILVVLLATFFLTMKKTIAKAQSTTSSSNDSPESMAESKKEIIVSGVVKDSMNQNQPVPFAAVTILHRNNVIMGLLTDSIGRFEYRSGLPYTDKDSLTLAVDCIGYSSATFTFKAESNQDMEIYLKESRIYLKTTTLLLIQREDTIIATEYRSLEPMMMGMFVPSHGSFQGEMKHIHLRSNTDIIHNDMVEPNKMRLPNPVDVFNP